MAFGDRNGRLAALLDGGRARQKTLRQSISCTGVGVHTGAKVHLTLHPAEAGAGIVFRRSDVRDRDNVIAARWSAVVDTRLCSVLGNEAGVTVGTVEHLMSALAGYGIDNVTVDLDGAEVPIMDGSAEPFAFLIECAGIVEQDEPRRAIQILRPVKVGDEGAYARLSPAAGFALSFEIDFDSPLIRTQRHSFDALSNTFRREIARARTFGFAHEVEALRKMGLARGGSLDNAVVVAHDKVLNRDGLRFPDEFVRHKLLDALGDMYLAGAPILGRFHGHRAGHALNNKLLRALFADQANWCWTTLAADDEADPAPLARAEARVARA
jgi:UDP-3-O-[3-hydroxymyristoyl] N-acetylglucosamine deacetylase